MSRDWLIHERLSYLADWAARLPGALRVLDAGCGAGLSLLYLQRRCARKVRHYVGIDLYTQRLRHRYQGLTVPHTFMDVDLDSAWRLGKFDLIFASEVMEHIVADRRLFGRLFDHLAANGVLVITTPNKAFIRRAAQTLSGFDSVSQIQDGGHVRVGYCADEMLELARGYPLAAISQSHLGGVSSRELKKRDALRRGAECINTVRFNPIWFMRRALGEDLTNAPDDQFWSITVAFQRHPETPRAVSVSEQRSV